MKKIFPLFMALILTISASACSSENQKEHSNPGDVTIVEASEEQSRSSSAESVTETSEEKRLTKESEYYAYDDITESAFKAEKGEFGFVSAQNEKQHEGFVNDQGSLQCRTHSSVDNSYILEDEQITITIDNKTYVLQRVDYDMYSKQLNIIMKKIEDPEESSKESSSEDEKSEVSKNENSQAETSKTQSSKEQSDGETSEESFIDYTSDWDPYNIDKTRDYTGSAIGDYGSINGSEYYGDYMLHITKNPASISVMMELNPDHVDLSKYGGHSIFFTSYPADYFKQPHPGKYWFLMDLYPSGTKTGSPLHVEMGKEPISREDGTYYWVTHCHIVYEDYSNDVDFYRAY